LIKTSRSLVLGAAEQKGKRTGQKELKGFNECKKIFDSNEEK